MARNQVVPGSKIAKVALTGDYADLSNKPTLTTGPQGDPGPAGSTGAAGAVGSTGAAGSAGATGAKGDTGSTGEQGIQGVPGSVGATGPAGATGSTGAAGSTGATGAAGSNASATPLGSATPQALGTAAAGSSANASREDHVHALPTGINTSLGTAVIAETTITTLTIGVRRVTVAVTGAVTGANYLAFPTAALPSGYGIVDAICSTNGQIVFGILAPILTLGSYSITVRVVKVGT